ATFRPPPTRRSPNEKHTRRATCSGQRESCLRRRFIKRFFALLLRRRCCVLHQIKHHFCLLVASTHQRFALLATSACAFGSKPARLSHSTSLQTNAPTGCWSLYHNQTHNIISLPTKNNMRV
ncbi:unnamed protein product, partial [Ectocarpus fasciculatus]